MDHPEYELRDNKNAKVEDRNGSPDFYNLLDRMGRLHHSKSHDYASNSNPFANYQFAGMLSKLFNNPDDAGFVGRIGEKLYRLANLENSGKEPKNETIQDTEVDICVITTLWMASRIERRRLINLKDGAWVTEIKVDNERDKTPKFDKATVDLSRLKQGMRRLLEDA